MRLEGRIAAAALMALLVAGCGIGARDVDYSPQRGYDADINASLDHGPTALQPGVSSAQEPLGALPWQLNESRQ